MNKGLRTLEDRANQWLHAIHTHKPEGSDRSLILSVHYCARGYFEAVTLSGSRDYVTVATVAQWIGRAALERSEP